MDRTPPARRAVLRAAALATALAAPLAALAPVAPARAQAFPSRPVTLVVPFAPGGPTDIVARLLAEAMTRDLGQAVVVENATGGGGTIGAAKVAGARPDGHTVLLHHIGMGVIPTLFRRLSYDPVEGFEPIGLVTEVPMTLVGRPGLPASTLPELVALIRRDGEKLNLADAGVGSSSALCGQMLQQAVGTRMTTIPFRGTGPAMSELLGNRVDVLCDQTTQTLEYIRAGALKVFAATTRARVSSLPDLPTAIEGGLPGFEVTVWHGLYAPRGTPAEIVARLSASLRTALRDPKVAGKFADIGTAPVAQDEATPEAHRRFWMADIAKWRPVIQAAGQYAD